MKLKYYVLFLLFASWTSFSSCGKDVDCSDEDAAEQLISAELSKLIGAGVTYELDPDNEDNCKKYKDAINSFLDEIEPYQECVSGADQADFEESLNEASKELDRINC